MSLLLLCLHYCYGFYFQITLWQIGYMPAQQGRSDALIQSTRLSNWRRSFCLICTSLETAGTRSLESWIWPRGRSKSGFRTGEWRWRKWTKKRPTAKNSNVGWGVRPAIITTSDMDNTDVPKHTLSPLLFVFLSFLLDFVLFGADGYYPAHKYVFSIKEQKEKKKR